MLLTMSSLLEKGEDIPEGYTDCVLVTGYPKRLFRNTEWDHITLAEVGLLIFRSGY